MLHLFYGTDRKKARDALAVALAKSDVAATIRITDAHATTDLTAALSGSGLFAEARSVVFEGVLSREDMREVLIDALEYMHTSSDTFFILEEKLDAATKKKVEKYAHGSASFELPKGTSRGFNVFSLAEYLKRADKKNLWVNYHRALAAGNAPEAIHGIFFWAAKDMALKSHGENERKRARALIARLAELPHESRRRGEDAEYALERFVLSIA